MADGNKNGGYGKRPLWQWILLYVVIGGIIYFGIFYYLGHRHTGNSATPTTRHSLY